jgi:hypothetical protein
MDPHREGTALKSARRATLEMMAELTREGGLLLGIFGFLEGSLRDPPAEPWWFVKVGIVSLVMMAVGIGAEKLRP